MPCNICDDALHQALLRGERDFLSELAPELHCPDCQSRPRTRTFRLMYDEHVAPLLSRVDVPGKALDVAGVGATRRILSADFEDVIVAALVGRPVTTDIRELAEFDDD